MKTQYSGAVARPTLAKVQEPKPPSYLEQVANEIFALLNDENCSESVQDLQLRLAEAANTLAQSVGPSEAEMQVALRGLSSDQLDVLFQHLGGMTCEQIAEQQRKTHRAVLDDLISAYVRLRFSLNWTGEPNAQMADDTSLGDVDDKK